MNVMYLCIKEGYGASVVLDSRILPDIRCYHRISAKYSLQKDNASTKTEKSLKGRKRCIEFSSTTAGIIQWRETQSEGTAIQRIEDHFSVQQQASTLFIRLQTTHQQKQFVRVDG